MTKSLSIDSAEGLSVAKVPVNQGVVKVLCVSLRSFCEFWHLITYPTRREHLVEYLTNEFDLEPGQSYESERGDHRQLRPPGHYHQHLDGNVAAPQGAASIASRT